MTLSSRAIDSASDALRRIEQSGKRLNDWSSLPNATKKKWRAKVEAITAALAAEGMVLVPKEPTHTMTQAGAARAKADDLLMQAGPSYMGEARNIYRAMLSAHQADEDSEGKNG